jgi:tetratricopeptide (TPR) repeat protein
VRHYAQERLAEIGGELDMRTRHLNWCLSLARKAEPHLDGPEMQDWLNRHELEHDNMRAALAFSQGENQLRLATSLYRFWYVRGYLKEGRDWLEGALRTDETVENALRATALNRAGILAWQQGDFAAARPLIEANLDIRKAEGDDIGTAAALNNLGLVAEDELDQTAARDHYEEALRIYRKMGDRAHTCMVLPNLGSILIDQGEWDAASLAYEEFLEIAEEIKDPWCTATAWHNLGEIAIHRGEWKSAADLTRRALLALMELGDKTQVIHLLIAIARIRLAVGSPERGVELLSAAKSYMTTEGIFLRRRDVREFELTIANARSLLGSETYDASWMRGAAIDADAGVRMALEIEADDR